MPFTLTACVSAGSSSNENKSGKVTRSNQCITVLLRRARVLCQKSASGECGAAMFIIYLYLKLPHPPLIGLHANLLLPLLWRNTNRNVYLQSIVRSHMVKKGKYALSLTCQAFVLEQRLGELIRNVMIRDFHASGNNVARQCAKLIHLDNELISIIKL